MENMRRKDQQLLEMNRENEVLKIKVQLVGAHKQLAFIGLYWLRDTNSHPWAYSIQTHG